MRPSKAIPESLYFWQIIVLGGLHREYHWEGSRRKGKEELSGHSALLASPQFLVAVRVRLSVPFVCNETHIPVSRVQLCGS